jgi:hypothetical protein
VLWSFYVFFVFLRDRNRRGRAPYCKKNKLKGSFRDYKAQSKTEKRVKEDTIQTHEEVTAY